MNFDYAINIVLKHEGGYSNDLNDSGGETNFGITQKELTKYYQQLNIPNNVKDLTENDAKIFYKSVYWDKEHYNSIDSIKITDKIFDLAVNLGAKQSFIITQRALCRLGITVVIDGILGNKTIGSLNKIMDDYTESQFLSYMRYEAILVYEMILAVHPSYEKFKDGWLIRACW